MPLANKVGYNPGGLSVVLRRGSERNKDQAKPNGMFASHPLIQDRLSNITKQIKDGKLTCTATVAARYTSTITFEAKPLDGDRSHRRRARPDRRRTAKIDTAKKEEPKKEEPKKKGGLFGKFTTSVERAEGVEPDRRIGRTPGEACRIATPRAARTRTS